MDYKCPGCGNVIQQSVDGIDCHFCGESLTGFWKNVQQVETQRAAAETRSENTSKIQTSIDNLEKALQELIIGKINGRNQFYFEKIARDNSPSQFTELGNSDEYATLYAALKSKYESYTALLNNKVKSAKTLKMAITAGTIVVVLIAAISVFSILNRADTSVDVTVNTPDTKVEVNNNVTVNTEKEIKSKYTSYVFQSADDAINYFISHKDFDEKLKCVNYPDFMTNVFNDIKKSIGNDFHKMYKKIVGQEEGPDGFTIYRVKGTDGIERFVVVTSKETGYRIALLSSLKFSEMTPTKFMLTQPKKEVVMKGELAFNQDGYKNDTWYRMKFMDHTTSKFWAYYDDVSCCYIKKDSKLGKRVLKELQDGQIHFVEMKVQTQENNNVTDKYYKDNNIAEITDITMILNSLISYTYANNVYERFKHNEVPAPKK